MIGCVADQLARRAFYLFVFVASLALSAGILVGGLIFWKIGGCS